MTRFNTAGTDAAFLRFLVEAIIASRKTGETFNYLEVGIAEGATLLWVADVIDLHCKEWNAIGVDIYRGPFFDPTRFLHSPQAGKFNIEILYEGSTSADIVPGFYGSPSITVALLRDGHSVKDCQFPRESMHFVLIDACHGAPCVERDFLAIEAAVSRGGIVAFHDAMPEDQGGECGQSGWQNHCQSGIAVRQALVNLNLLPVEHADMPCRSGWELAGFVSGDKQANPPGNGFVFFRRIQ